MRVILGELYISQWHGILTWVIFTRHIDLGYAMKTKLPTYLKLNETLVIMIFISFINILQNHIHIAHKHL